MSYQAVIKELGLKMLSATPMEFVKVARKGIPKKTIDALAKKQDIFIFRKGHCSVMSPGKFYRLN